MKLRFHENTLRLRLSRNDVAKFATTGSVEETLTFGAGRSLSYRIEAGSVPEVSASFIGSRIAVHVPNSQARRWAETSQVGIEASTLKILIEKDFQCLHEDGAVDPEAFPNPAAKAL